MIKSKLLYLFSILFLSSSIGYSQVANGDFESWTSGNPDDWTTIDAGISVAQNTSISRSGSSARITVNTASQSSTDFRQSVNVTPGQPYTFSVWVRHTEGGVRARLYVDGYRGYSNGNTVNTWQQITYTFTPSSSTILVGLRFYDQSGFDGSEVVYVDDFEPTSSSGGGGGDPSCTDATLTLNTDNYGSETSWTLKNSAGATLFSGSGFSNNATFTDDFCLEDGTYTFTINDSYGDGICCAFGNGSYNLASGGNVLASGGNFTSSESTTFTIGGGGSSGGGGADGTGYYANADGLSGYTLKTALYNIIKGHNSRGYGALWGFYSNNELDNYYENDGTILDIYSEKPNGSDSYSYTKVTNQCGSFNSEADCYNREHSFPRSWFGGSREPMNSDVHHIFASDGFVNGKRSSFPYGEVGSATFTSTNGSKVGSAASGLGYSGTVFEPIDEFKGDLARAYFYMATRYENVVSGWENNNSNGNAMLDGSGNKVFESWALTMLLQWHQQDPVSQKEIDRNAAAFTHQGNRNPYVDHPEYVGLIWNAGSSARRGNIAANSIWVSDTDLQLTYGSGMLDIKGAGLKSKGVSILDLAGKEVLRQNYPVRKGNVQIPAQLNSHIVYLINIYTAEGLMTRKFMVLD